MLCRTRPTPVVATEPVNRPSSHLIEQAAGDATTKEIIAGAFVSAFGAADPSVGKDCHNIPPMPLGDGFKLALLILDGLLCRGTLTRA